MTAIERMITLSTLTGDVGPVLDALAWQKAHLVGMSYGGMTAAHFAAAAPERVASLATVDVGPGVIFEGSARMREFFQRVDPRLGPEATAAAALQTSPLTDPERLAYHYKAMMRRRETGEWDWAFDERRRIDYPAILAKVEEMVVAAEQLTAPMLVVCGGCSPVFPDNAAARFASRFVRGEWIVVPDAGHNVQEDNPAGLVTALLRFWLLQMEYENRDTEPSPSCEPAALATSASTKSRSLGYGNDKGDRSDAQSHNLLAR